jgi:hypothetical protein
VHVHVHVHVRVRVRACVFVYVCVCTASLFRETMKRKEPAGEASLVPRSRREILRQRLAYDFSHKWTEEERTNVPARHAANLQPHHRHRFETVANGVASALGFPINDTDATEHEATLLEHASEDLLRAYDEAILPEQTVNMKKWRTRTLAGIVKSLTPRYRLVCS